MTTAPLPPKTPLTLGSLLCAAGLAQAKQVQTALDKQHPGGERLGDALVNRAQLARKDLVATLMVQQGLRDCLHTPRGSSQHALPDCLRLGELLVARGEVPRAVLNQALAQQHGERRLGDVLLQMGAITSSTLDAVLPLQKRLISAVLCAGLGFAFAFTPRAARRQGLARHA
jgi:hypothetical protein